MKPLKYAVLDVETGGLDPARHPLIEVAYVLEDGREVEFSLHFWPEDCTQEALKINGWGYRPFAPEIWEIDALDVLREDLHDRLVVASPAHFDIGFLEAFWRKKSPDRPPWSHTSIIDLKSYACGVFGEMRSLKNSEISARLGIEDTSDHSALADARWTAEMFRALLDLSDPSRRAGR